ncbi:hypothetical protein OF83DRAFT_1177339 [Amylostereum chailletii]|nr:hypothetical protein OF83DRAFT_1177339 [Amylostereum chailletii]
MASYFRSLFGGSSSTSGRSKSSSAPSPAKLTKTHSRQHSTPVTNMIYAPLPGTSPSAASHSSSRTNVHRANSYTATPTTRPSPLRYPTYDSARGASFDSSRPTTSRGGSFDSSPVTATATSSRSSPIYRNKPHDGRYPHFVQTTGYATSASSRSNSSSSLYPGSVHGGGSVPSPLASSTHANVKASHGDRRPQLKQTHTWPNAGVAASTSTNASNRESLPYLSPPLFTSRPPHIITIVRVLLERVWLNHNFPFRFTDGQTALPTRSKNRPAALCMHPLLAYTRRHPAPISFDVVFTPSARSVLDRTVHAPVPAHTLAQPATEPPTSASSRLVLRSDKFPWLVVVGPVGSSPSFFLGSGSKSSKSSAALTNLDLLYAVHTTLMTRVTPEEWASLGHGSKAQRKVAAAYEKRCTRMGGGWEGGVRRIDWLHSKTHLVGVEMDKNGAAGGSGKVGKLVFGRA